MEQQDSRHNGNEEIPAEYLRRLAHAQDLMLTTDEPLPGSRSAVGSAIRHMTRLFRRAPGTTPSVWRRRNKSEHAPTLASTMAQALPTSRTFGD